MSSVSVEGWGRSCLSFVCLVACTEPDSSRDVGTDSPSVTSSAMATEDRPDDDSSSSSADPGTTSTSEGLTTVNTGTTTTTTGASCALGTPDHCDACDSPCPGTDGATTVRLCEAGECDLHCLLEFYDVNGSPHDGCEAEDVPVQDTPETAVEIDVAKTFNHVGTIYGDDRVHDEPLPERPLGRDDRYAVTATGSGMAGGMVACLGITNFPADNMFEVCIGDPGDDDLAAAACATATGGRDSQCVSPPAGGDEGGPYPIRVRKLAGTNTDNGYALFLQH